MSNPNVLLLLVGFPQDAQGLFSQRIIASKYAIAATATITKNIDAISQSGNIGILHK